MPKIERDKVKDFPVRIIVAGSRTYLDYEDFCKQINDILFDLDKDMSKVVFISGLAKGPDTFIVDYCKERKLNWAEYAADWDNLTHPNAVVKRNDFGKLYNAVAGHIRNTEMAEDATVLIAFWDQKSTGTKNMIATAAKYHLTTYTIHIERKS